MEPRPARTRDVMSVPEAGQRLGLSPKASYDAAARGTFPVIRNGRRKWVSVAEFDAWLAGACRITNWPQKGAPE